MSAHGGFQIGTFKIIERTTPSAPRIVNLEEEIYGTLTELDLPQKKLVGRRIAITLGSRGIADLKRIVSATCGWLRQHGADPFVVPAMGSHGGATAEGQRRILKEYGITPNEIGVEVRSDMATVSVGTTQQGFRVFMDRNAWEADAVLVLNRVRPHTDFSGNIESGLIKMMAVGLGKRDGAEESHRWSRKYGFEKVLCSVAGVILESGKVLCGMAVVENELHEIAIVKAALPDQILTMERTLLPIARKLVPRLPFSELDLLVVDRMGKNISGTGMDTKIVGRGVELQPHSEPVIGLIYVRSLSEESSGNAVGVGLADAIHERLYRDIDLYKTYINVQTALNPPMARIPMHFISDGRALKFLLGVLGSPDPGNQRIAWIRSTLDLKYMAISTSLVPEALSVPGWQQRDVEISLKFDEEDNIIALV